MAITPTVKQSIPVGHFCDGGFTIGALSEETALDAKVEVWKRPKAVALILYVSTIGSGVGLMLPRKEMVNEMILSLQRMRDEVWPAATNSN